MRCAALLYRLTPRGTTTYRRGTGLVVEVYPAASLKQWGLPYRGYKGPRHSALLSELVDSLLSTAQWLSFGEHEEVCRRSDHAFDAVIAALTARAVALNLTTTPSPDESRAAAVEAWIAVPTSPLRDLSR